MESRTATLEHLAATIRHRAPGMTSTQALAIGSLWILRHRILTLRLMGRISSAAFKRFAKELRGREEQLNRAQLLIYRGLRGLPESDGLWALLTQLLDLRIRPWREYRCTAEMVQWAVGQGGFWTTSSTYRSRTGNDERTVEVIFDCGSSTAGGLERALKEFRPTHGKIDYLFLSHLDTDHTSGVDHLLKNYEINTVVMPLLTPAATLLAAARFAASDELSEEQVQLLTDPGSYLTRRGVRRTILVEQAPEDGLREAAAPDPDDSPPRFPDLESVDSGARVAGDPDIIVNGPGGTSHSVSFPQTQIVPHGTTIWLRGPDGGVFWQLSPYIHPFEPARVGRFMQSAYRLLDAAGTDARTALRSLLTSPQGHRDLKRLYRLVRSDHNAVSMSLFSCPRGSGELAQLWLSVPSAMDSLAGVPSSSRRFGWLHTGDSTLARDSYRRAWLDYYQHVFKQLAVLVVPHHGSRHNFHRDLISIPKPSVALACAASKNAYGHPTSVVARTARSHGAEFRQVDERPANEVVGVYFG